MHLWKEYSEELVRSQLVCLNQETAVPTGGKLVCINNKNLRRKNMEVHICFVFILL